MHPSYLKIGIVLYFLYVEKGQSRVVWENPGDRIVEGERINITQVPYMLSLMLYGKHACGASVINENWGMTAAHCAVVVSQLSEVTVRSGSDILEQGGTVHQITKLIWHEHYNPIISDYDIAVFKVDPPFEYSNVTRPVKLPIDYATTDTSLAMISGWGYYSSFISELSEYLQYVIVPLVPKDQCIKDYFNRFEVTPRQVCYGYERGGKDSCQGDSGGALVNPDSIAVGLSSWGDDCGKMKSPGVYTDVIYLTDWVREKTDSKESGETESDEQPPISHHKESIIIDEIIEIEDTESIIVNTITGIKKIEPIVIDEIIEIEEIIIFDGL